MDMKKFDSLLSDIAELEEGDERSEAPEETPTSGMLSNKASEALNTHAQLTDPDRWIEL